ncbi:MAG: HepT-like ribonuclease domain-containing protein [Bryobacteraceae bacterium]|nr:HepT-like ribonuclease domain-containing protein [Bryobacteraceae bacterium]
MEDLQSFVLETDEARFIASPLEQSYIFQRLVILGEAAVSLAKTFEARHPEIPWSRLIALRNRLVHAYFDLDQSLLWNIATTRLDELHSQLQSIRAVHFPPDRNR